MVLELYKRIKKHPGHRNAMVLLDDELDDRLFPDWSMGFQRLERDALAEMAGYTDMDAFVNSQEKPHPVFTFLKLFYQKNFLDPKHHNADPTSGRVG